MDRQAVISKYHYEPSTGQFQRRGSRSKKNKQLMDALKDATCTAPTK